jgi:hypothetical protein
LTVRPALIFPANVRVTFLPETEVESTEYVSPPTKTVKALAGAVELDKFSLKTLGPRVLMRKPLLVEMYQGKESMNS